MAVPLTTTLVVGTASVTLTDAGGTAFTDATTHTIDVPKEGHLLVKINSTYAGGNTASVAAGEFLSNGQGALSIVTAENGVYYVLLDGSRHKDFDGDITITYGTSNTGFTQAFLIP